MPASPRTKTARPANQNVAAMTEVLEILNAPAIVYELDGEQFIAFRRAPLNRMRSLANAVLTREKKDHASYGRTESSVAKSRKAKKKSVTGGK